MSSFIAWLLVIFDEKTEKELQKYLIIRDGDFYQSIESCVLPAGKTGEFWERGDICKLAIDYASLKC